MNRYTSVCVPALLLVAVLASQLPAAEKPDKAPALTVAVLDFAASDPGNPQLGTEIAEVLTVMLSGESGISLVERRTLARTLQEHELNLTGLVKDDDAIKVGKLVGAKIMITGRAFTLGSKMFVTAKLIGTETSLIEGVMANGKTTADLGELVVELSGKVIDKIRKVGPKLVAQDDAGADPLPSLKKKLASRKLPVVAVLVREQHHASPRARQPIDPAVETEIKKLLLECGFTVQDIPENELTDFADGFKPGDVGSWPRSLAEVDVLIAGEAFSEFGARIGNIVSCSARAEVNVISREDGKVVFSDRETTRAADLSENIAGKKALQKAGRTIGLRVLKHFGD